MTRSDYSVGLETLFVLNLLVHARILQRLRGSFSNLIEG